MGPLFIGLHRYHPSLLQEIRAVIDRASSCADALPAANRFYGADWCSEAVDSGESASRLPARTINVARACRRLHARQDRASLHVADADLDTLFTTHESSEGRRIVVAKVIRENDLWPHCSDRISEHRVIHGVELDSETRIVNR